jgi:hypothetical protein
MIDVDRFNQEKLVHGRDRRGKSGKGSMDRHGDMMHDCVCGHGEEDRAGRGADRDPSILDDRAREEAPKS